MIRMTASNDAIEAARIAEESEREMIGWAADALGVQ